jgi:hypothetical protein
MTFIRLEGNNFEISDCIIWRQYSITLSLGHNSKTKVNKKMNSSYLAVLLLL